MKVFFFQTQSELEILLLTERGLPRDAVAYMLKKPSTSPAFQLVPSQLCG